MNEKSKLYIVLGFVAVIIITIIGFFIAEDKKSEKIYNTFMEKWSGSENSLVYIGSSTCSYCNLLNPSLEDMKSRYGFDYYYIDINVINAKYLNKIVSVLNLSELKTPYLAIVAQNKIVEEQKGYSDYDKMFDYLQRNNIIKDDAKLLLNYINYDEYAKLIKSSKPQVIVVGQSTCGYCVNAKIRLNNIAASNDIDINYLNITYLSTEEKNKFYDSFEYFKGKWGTPVTLIVKNGEIVNKLEQLVSEEEYINFFKSNGVM